MNSPAFLKAIQDEAAARGLRATDVPSGSFERLVQFHAAMAAENQVQNLTRLISHEDFIEGHLIDCFELTKTGWTGSELCADLGSGCGVPGIPMAILNPAQNWLLVESEARKATFLEAAKAQLELNNIAIYPGRFESIRAGALNPKTVVCRAVGSVLKVFRWSEHCSTWNNLILFKGPRWEEEWKEFQHSSEWKKLKITDEYSYQATPAMKSRKLIRLTRQ